MSAIGQLVLRSRTWAIVPIGFSLGPRAGFVNLTQPSGEIRRIAQCGTAENASFLAQLTIVRIANVTKPGRDRPSWLEHCPAMRASGDCALIFLSHSVRGERAEPHAHAADR